MLYHGGHGGEPMSPVEPSTAAGVGIDRIECVISMENHDRAYHAWREAGAHDRILVHVDAHHDLRYRGDKAPLTIGNFISSAIADGMVRQVYWIVPDPTWESSDDRREIAKQVRRLIDQYPGPRQPLRIAPDRMSTTLGGVPVVVGALACLPAFDEPVLLDIDTDYLAVAHVYYESDGHLQLPWCWPDALVARLTTADLRTDCLTIARSVEGGYTPLRWRYLADEIAARLQSPGEASPAFDNMRAGAEAAQAGRVADAEQHFARAAAALPTMAAPHYHGALLCLQDGRPDEARSAFGRAVEIDAAYRTRFSNSGLAYFRERRFDEAEREIKGALTLDDSDAYAHFGLGRLAALDRRWAVAEQELRLSLALAPTIVEAHRALAYVYAENGRTSEAIAAYDQSLLLGLMGHVGINDPRLLGDAGETFDPDHCRVHGEVGRLYARKGDWRSATASYRMCIAGGHPRAADYARLAAAALRSGDWRTACRAAGQAARRLPAGWRRSVTHTWEYLRAVVRKRALPVLVPPDLG
jgi:Flp pilus assembly protein TadD